MPLAILRKRVSDLPLQFSLDDSMAMAPGMRISAFPRVVVGARVSKSGQAKPQPGDLQGASAPVANDAAGVSVVIDSVVR
jgi:cytochrome c-type biogenesis protein CcmH